MALAEDLCCTWCSPRQAWSKGICRENRKHVMVRQAWWSRLRGRQEEAAQKAPAEMAGTAPGQNLWTFFLGYSQYTQGTLFWGQVLPSPHESQDPKEQGTA